MWSLGQKASESNKLPSECVPGLDEIVCDWTIWQFDNGIMFFFSVMKNALAETEKIGNESQAKYTLSQLLEDDFRLPRPLSHKQQRRQVGVAVRGLVATTSRIQVKGKPKSMIPESLAKQLRARGIHF